MGGGGSSGNTTTTTTTQPWAGQQPFLMNEMQSASNLFNTGNVQGNGQPSLGPANSIAGSPQYFPGSTYAPLEPMQNNAINEVYALGMGGGVPALDAAEATAGGIESPNYTAATQGTFNAVNPAIAVYGNGVLAQTPQAVYNNSVGTQAGLASGDVLNQTQGAFGQGQGLLSNEINGSYLNPATDPGFQSVVNTTLANVMPSITSGFVGAGRSDSGLASRAAAQGATDAIGNLTLQNYLTERQNQNAAASQASQNEALGVNSAQNAANLGANTYLGAIGATEQAQQQAAQNMLQNQQQQVQGMFAIPGLDQATMGDVQSAYNAAGQYQTNAQNALNAAIDAWNYNQMLPWNTLGLEQGLISGNYGSQSQTSTPYYSNPVASHLSGALGGAAAGATLGSVVPGIGTAIGALGGALFGGIL